MHTTEDDSATQEEEQQIEKVLDTTAVDTGESAAKSQGSTMDNAYGLTARITLAKLRSLHMHGSHSIPVNYGNTFANSCNTFVYFHITSNTFGAALTNLSLQQQGEGGS